MLRRSRERDRKWVERCKPVMRQDAYGVSRYVYAARGCEHGRIEIELCRRMQQRQSVVQ